MSVFLAGTRVYAFLIIQLLLLSSVWVTAAGMSACSLDNVVFRAGVDVTRSRYNSTNGSITFNSTNSFVLYAFKEKVRVDLRLSTGTIAQAYGSMNGGVETHVLRTSDGTCPSATEAVHDVLHIAKSLYSVMRAVAGVSADVFEPVVYHGMSMMRLTQIYRASSAALPMGASTVGDYNEYEYVAHFLQPHQGQLDFVVPSNCGILKYISLERQGDGLSTEAEVVNVTFDSVGLATVSADALDFSCPKNPTAAPTAVPSAGPISTPMPDFPSQYSARILTTEVDTGNSFTMVSSYNAALRRARVRVAEPVLDYVGRATSYIWDVIGTDQTAYYYIQRELPAGVTSLVTDGVREYFWPNVQECHRAVFTTDILSGSLGGLFAAVGKNIIFMGEELVRGIPSRRWQTSNGTLVIDWYWANASWNFARRSKEDGDVLVRISIRGTGQSPLFVNHPFFQQAANVPSNVASDACSTLFPQSIASCKGGFTPSYVFFHVHDVVDFTPYVDEGDRVLPDACKAPTSVEVYGSIGCLATTESTATVIAILLVIVLVFGCGMCCQWCRMTPRMREVEEELQEAVKAMHEHQQQLERVQQQQQQQQPLAAAAAGVVQEIATTRSAEPNTMM